MEKLLLLLLFLHVQYSSGQNVTNPEVTTQHGTITGQVESTPLGVNVEVFKGIPFAVPPIGARRFANPEYYGQFPGGVWNADRYRDACPQRNRFPAIVAKSEDCLYLNIWRPQAYESSRAVMVWIHAGGYSAGASSQLKYSGNVLSVVGDVIVVSMNYRLGVLGFLPLGDDRLPNGNQGLLDQQMALRWVYENIEAFGGDPQRVTIFGESAGAESVNHLLLMPDIGLLFTRAIMQSGVSNAYWSAQSPQAAAGSAEWISNRTKCPNDETFIECLRERPAEDLVNKTIPDPGKPLYGPYMPRVDGVTIPDFPLRMMQSGQMHKKDILLGMNKDEGSFMIYDFPGVDPVSTVVDPIGTYTLVVEDHFAILQNLTQDEIDAVLEAYEPLDENGINKAKISISDICGDMSVLCPTQQAARAFDAHGMKVYLYYLTYRASTSRNPEWEGVKHADDIQWVFGLPLQDILPYEDEEKTLTMEVMKKWTDFAKYGSPDNEWPTYSSAGGPAYVEIRGPSDFVYVTGDDVRGEFCELWNFSDQDMVRGSCLPSSDQEISRGCCMFLVWSVCLAVCLSLFVSVNLSI